MTLQAGATGAVKAIKMSATLTAARHQSNTPAAARDPQIHRSEEEPEPDATHTSIDTWHHDG